MTNFNNNKKNILEASPLLNLTLWPNRSLSKKHFYVKLLVIEVLFMLGVEVIIKLIITIVRKNRSNSFT